MSKEKIENLESLFDALETVVIRDPGFDDHKFCLFRVSFRGRTKNIIRTWRSYGAHHFIESDFISELRETFSEITVKCLGGGFMKVFKSPRSLQTHLVILRGDSYDYGKEDREVSAQILKEKFPDADIVVN